MAYFEFNGNAPQTQQVRQLKSNLQSALGVALKIQAESAQMSQAQAQTQWGIPATGLTLAQWQTTIDAIVTALEAPAIANLTNQVGFTL